MKFLIWFVAALAFISTELVIFTGGIHYGLGDKQVIYAKGYADAVNDEGQRRLDFILDRMAFYESSYNAVARGDYDGRRYLAYGLYQFHRPTFMWLARLSGNPKLDWKNPEHQHRVAKWAIQHGYGKLWGNTYRHALHDYFMKSTGEK